MISSFLPTVFRFLTLNPNRAVDDALARVLPTLDASSQEASWSLLLRRGHRASLTYVAVGYGGYDEGLRNLLAESTEKMRPVLRVLIGSKRSEESLSAVSWLTASKNPSCADLLGEGLFAADRRTRAAAAQGLREVAEITLKQPRSAVRAAGTPTSPAVKEKEVDALEPLVSALEKAVRLWESHEMEPALEAALWFSDRLHRVLREKTREPRTSIVRALIPRLRAVEDARCAGFLVRALAIPALKSAAAEGITSAQGAALREAIVNHAWLLADPAVEHGARSLREVNWIAEYLEGAGTAGAHGTAAAMRWLQACGDAPEKRRERLHHVLSVAASAARGDALWALAQESDDRSVGILSALAERREDPLARLASRVVRRYRRGIGEGAAGMAQVPSRSGEVVRPSACETYWMDADPRPDGDDRTGRQTPPHREWLEFLRRKLSSHAASDRLRALSFLERDGLVTAAQEQVLRLVHDADGGVRARAVQALPRVEGAAGARVARLAAQDPDPRVEANAVEALERMDAPDRAAVARTRLDSAHARVRGNAVKSLLAMEMTEAAEALLAMLEDESAAHRLSGVWVVGQLRLRSLGEQLGEMAAKDASAAVRHACAQVLLQLGAATVSHPAPESGHAEPSR